MSTIDYGGYNGTDATVYLYYHYIPKQSPAVVAIFVFLALGLINLAITFKTKAWFMLIVALTAFLEVGGFIFRVAVLHNPTIGNVAITQALLVISPIFLALVDYEAVGKLMKLGQGTGRLRPGLVAKLFFGSDILCLLIQVGGAGMTAKQTPTAQRLSRNLLIAGLALQLGFFSLFTVLTVYVHQNRKYNLRGVPALRNVWICLYSTIIILYIRSIYRLIEFVAGYHSAVATKELYFYILDFLMIVLCVVLFSVYHYGLYLRKEAIPPPLGLVQAHWGNFMTTPSDLPFASQAVPLQQKASARPATEIHAIA